MHAGGRARWTTNGGGTQHAAAHLGSSHTVAATPARQQSLVLGLFAAGMLRGRRNNHRS